MTSVLILNFFKKVYSFLIIKESTVLLNLNLTYNIKFNDSFSFNSIFTMKCAEFHEL